MSMLKEENNHVKRNTENCIFAVVLELIYFKTFNIVEDILVFFSI